MQEIILQTVKHWGHQIPEKDFNFGINLLEKRFNSKVTMNEFLKECVYFLLNSNFEDMRFRPYPTRPSKLLQYAEYKQAKPNFEAKESFWHEPEIATYISQKDKIRQQNIGNLYWLRWILTKLESYGDEYKIMQVRARIQEFEDN